MLAQRASKAVRLLAGNVSREGMFLRSPRMPARGARLALALEAHGQVLPFAEAEVIWTRKESAQQPSGFGVRFVAYAHPRARALLDYLVANVVPGGVKVPRKAGPVPMAPAAVSDEPPPSVLGRKMGWEWRAAGAGGLALLAMSLWLSVRPREGAGQAAQNVPVAHAQPTAAAAAMEAEAPAAARQPAAPLDELAVSPAAESPAAEAPAAKSPAAESQLAELPLAAPPPAESPLPARQAELRNLAAAIKAVGFSSSGPGVQLALELAEGASIRRVFPMAAPPRLVIDLQGPAPARSHVLPAPAGYGAKAVRLGSLADGTRVVVDLNSDLAAVQRSGNIVSLAFVP